MTYPAGTPSMWTTRPHEPHSSRPRRPTPPSPARWSRSRRPACRGLRQLPEHAPAATFGQIVQVVQRERRHVPGHEQDLRRPISVGRWGVAAAVRVDNPDDRSIQPDSHPVSCDRQLRHDEGQNVPPSWLHSIGSPLPKRQRRPRVATPRPRSVARHRAIRGAYGGDDGIGDPRAVRRGEQAGGRLAGGRDAQHRRAADGRAGRRGRRSRRPAKARSRCSTARRRADPSCASRSAR